MALFLPLMFGAMVGDVGYGVVLLALGARRPPVARRARAGAGRRRLDPAGGRGVGDRLRRPVRRALRRPRQRAVRRLGAVAVPARRRRARAAAAVRRRDRRGPRRPRTRAGGLAGRPLRRAADELLDKLGSLLVLGGLFGVAGWAADQLPAGALTPSVAAAVVGLVLVMSPHGALGLITGAAGAPGQRSGTSSPTCGSPPSAWRRRISRASRTSSATVGPIWMGVLVAAFFHALNLALAVVQPDDPGAAPALRRVLRHVPRRRRPCVHPVRARPGARHPTHDLKEQTWKPA